jgi:hypothetical protein
MGLVKRSAVALTLAALVVTPLHAAQRGRSGAHAPAAAPKGPKTVPHGPTSSTHGPTSHGPSKAGGPAAVPHGQSAKAQTGSSTKVKGKPTTTTATTANSTSGTASSPASTAAATSVDFTSGKAGQLLTKNDALRSRLETRLQAVGYTGTVYQAAYGFKNAGQFIAATNVSQNLAIPFEQLKLQMTGLSVSPAGVVLQANTTPGGTIAMVDPADATSPAPTQSLGQAIHTFNTDVNATTTAQTATRAADAEIAGTTATTAKSTTPARRSTPVTRVQSATR